MSASCRYYPTILTSNTLPESWTYMQCDRRWRQYEQNALPWTKELAKESVATMGAGAAYSMRWQLICARGLSRRDAAYYDALDGLYVLLNVRVQQDRSDNDGTLNLSQGSTFNSEWYVNEMRAPMHQIWIWYEPVMSSYLTSYSNLYPSIKHFGLCGADFGVYTEPTEPKWFADRPSDRWHCICTAPAVLIYHIYQMGIRWLPHGMCDI